MAWQPPRSMPVPVVPARRTSGKGELPPQSGNKTAVLLDAARLLGKLHFLYGHEHSSFPSEVVHDLDFPQREAAFFYGLFLRGHSADKLRRDIEVPAVVLAKWHREAEHDPQLR